jgi:outer membrane protein
MKMAKYLTLLSLFFVLQSQAAHLKVAFVNTERILRESAPAIRAGKKLENEFEPRKKELIKRSTQLQQLQSQLKKDKASEQARRTQEREMLRLEQELKRMQLEFNEDTATRRNEELSKLNSTVTKAIEQLVEKEKIDLVLQEAVYHSERIDVTDHILRYLLDK